MESEKVKEIKKALEERTQHKPINCCNAEYVEACGMYCRHHREFVADMGSKNGQTCKNCSNFIATDEVKEYADILTLINELESDNERLKTQLAQANAGIVNCSGCKFVEINAVREFAERLKDKFYYVFGNEYEQSVSGFNTKVLIESIDETLMEYEK